MPGLPLSSDRAIDMTTENDKPANDEPKAKLVSVVAAKAFLTATGWVKIGDSIDVTAQRKRELARNGLIVGSTADIDDAPGGQTSTPLGEGRQTKRKLTVGATKAAS